MNPVGKALWYIESHFREELTLADIAAHVGVSPFYLSRAFGAGAGYAVMSYVRARRLSEAARTLAQGAPDILTVALDSGYGSHEAFTRAFRDHFGLTPESVRAQGHVLDLSLVEALKMDETLLEHLAEPRLVESKPVLIAGLGARYDCETSAGIPAQWQRFIPYLGHIPAQIGRAAYGVCCNQDETGAFDYICGVEVSDFSGLPADWSRVRIPARRYAVFSHRGPVSEIRRTWNTIWNQWLPQSGFEVADAPDFERYGENFDAASGRGDIENWLPLKN